MKPQWLPMLCCCLGLFACDGERPTTRTQDASASSATSAPAANTLAATRVADTDLVARLGMVFNDADPWMAGAVLVRGRMQVGDRLFLLTRDDQRIAVRITAIRDDITQSALDEAAAPRGVFLSFRREPSAAAVAPGTEPLLTGDPAAVDYSQLVP